MNSITTQWLESIHRIPISVITTSNLITTSNVVCEIINYSRHINKMDTFHSLAKSITYHFDSDDM